MDVERNLHGAAAGDHKSHSKLVSSLGGDAELPSSNSTTGSSHHEFKKGDSEESGYYSRMGSTASEVSRSSSVTDRSRANSSLDSPETAPVTAVDQTNASEPSSTSEQEDGPNETSAGDSDRNAQQFNSSGADTSGDTTQTSTICEWLSYVGESEKGFHGLCWEECPQASGGPLPPPCGKEQASTSEAKHPDNQDTAVKSGNKVVPDSDSPPNESVSDQHEYGSHRVKRKEAVMLLTPPSGPPSSDGRFTITIEELLGSPPSSGAKGCRVAEDSGQYTTEPRQYYTKVEIGGEEVQKILELSYDAPDKGCSSPCRLAPVTKKIQQEDPGVNLSVENPSGKPGQGLKGNLVTNKGKIYLGVDKKHRQLKAFSAFPTDEKNEYLMAVTIFGCKRCNPPIAIYWSEGNGYNYYLVPQLIGQEWKVAVEGDPQTKVPKYRKWSTDYHRVGK